MRIFIFILFFSFVFGSCLWAGPQAVIITIDNNRLEGEISNSGILVEWRKDIYEVKNKEGADEKFFLVPGNKGKFRLSDIKEITRINPDSAPDKVTATLEDGSTAKLIQNYRIIFQNNKIFYISDFITLNSFYIDLDRQGNLKRVYFSHIKNLRIGAAAPALQPEKKEKPTLDPKKIEKPAPVPVKTEKKAAALKEKIIKSEAPLWIKGNEKKFLKKKVFLSSSFLGISSDYLPYIIILTALLFILLCVLIVLFFKIRRPRHGKEKNKKVLRKKVKKKSDHRARKR